MHSSELKGTDNLYYWVLRAIEYLDDGEFLEGIMLLEDCIEAREMIQNEDWPGVLECIEKLRGHMEDMEYL